MITVTARVGAKWLEDILRARLGFRGAVFSDDLSMQAARQLDGQTVSYTQAALAAFQAGCDMVLLCNQGVGDGAAIDGLLAGLAQAHHDGRWIARAASEQRRVALLPRSAALPWDELMVHAPYMAALDLVP